MRITFRRAIAGEAEAAGRSSGIPRYPWRISPAVWAAEEKLRWPISLDVTDGTLQQVLDRIEAECGVTIDRSRIGEEMRRITFQMQEIPAANALSLLLRQYDLRSAIADDGTLRIGRDGEISDLPEVSARHGLERAMQVEAGDEDFGRPTEMDRRIDSQLRESTLTLDMKDAPLTDAVAFFREYVPVNVILDATDSDPAASLVTVGLSGRSADEVLREIARQAGRDVIVERGVVMLVPLEQAAKQAADRAGRMAKIDAELATRVALDGTELPGHRLAEEIGRQTGRTVIVSEEVWTRAEPLRVPRGDRPLREVLDYVTRQAELRWRLVDGVFYVY